MSRDLKTGTIIGRAGREQRGHWTEDGTVLPGLDILGVLLDILQVFWCTLALGSKVLHYYEGDSSVCNISIFDIPEKQILCSATARQPVLVVVCRGPVT